MVIPLVSFFPSSFLTRSKNSEARTYDENKKKKKHIMWATRKTPQNRKQNKKYGNQRDLGKKAGSENITYGRRARRGRGSR